MRTRALLFSAVVLIVAVLETTSAQRRRADTERNGDIVDLLEMLGRPSGDSGIEYSVGVDGFPAFKIGKNAKVESKPASVFFSKETIQHDFSILLTFRLLSDNGALFSIMDPYGVKNQFGLELIYDAEKDQHALRLYYTPESRLKRRSEILTEFYIKGLKNRWTKLGVKILDDTAYLFKNCELVSTRPISKRIPIDLEAGSPITILENGFVGDLMEMKIYRDPEAASQDDCNFPIDSDMSGSGSDPDDGSLITIDEEGEGVTSGSDRLPGLQGPKGGRGIPGPPGPPGPPGRAVVSSSGTSSSEGSGSSAPVQFENVSELQRMSATIPIGTLAFVINTESLYIRVSQGWRNIVLGTDFIEILPEPPANIIRPRKTTTTTARTIQIPSDGAVANNRPRLHLIALNEPHTGRLRGIRGADLLCHREARDSNMNGTFRAFLSSSDQNLDSLVYYPIDRNVPIVNSKNEVLFNSWNDLLSGSGGTFNGGTAIYSFDGKNVKESPTWPMKVVWHGSDRKGNRMVEKSCHGWSSHSRYASAYGSPLMENKMMSMDEYSCNNSFVVLCVEITSQRTLKKK